VNDFKDGRGSYLKLRVASVNANGNRAGKQKIEFLRTTAIESYGDDECADWRIGTNNTCGLDIHRKATYPTFCNLHDGNVKEFKQDCDVNVVKAGGLKISSSPSMATSYTEQDVLETVFSTKGSSVQMFSHEHSKTC